MGHIAKVCPILLLSLLFWAQNLWSSVDMKEGLWEVEINEEMHIPGALFKLPSRQFKIRKCLARDHMVPLYIDEFDKVCKIVNERIQGSTVVWEMECKDRHSLAKGRGNATYKGNEFSANVTITTLENGMKGPTEIRQHMKGHWIGLCKKR